jgi:hypothetical protein
MTLSRRTVLKAGAASGALLLARPALAGPVGPSLWRSPATAATAPPAGLHLGLGADAARTAVVSWSTPGSVAGAVIDIGRDGSYGLTLAADSRAVAGHETVYHHGVLRGLQPDTRYRYRVRHRGAPAVTGTFRTAPDAARPFRFATFGDMGVTAAAAEVMGLLERSRPDLAFLVGDLCYANPGGGLAETEVNQAVWDRWFEQVGRSAGAVPWMPAVGNHEMEPGFGELGYDGFLSRFALPGGGPSPVTWSFRYGNVGFVALDGNDASHEIPRNRGYLGAAQDEWLDRTLGALRRDPKVDFIVVGFHHCAFSTNAVHASDGGVRERWTPIFDRHTVDLVVNGHNHSYERTAPIRDGAPTVEAPTGATVRAQRDGTTYVLAGGGGQAAYQSGLHPASYVTVEPGVRIPETAPWSAVRFLDNSLVLVDVTPRTPGRAATMQLRAVDRQGVVVDRVTLER